MSTFNELLADESSGLVWLLDVSFDDFATVSYRWSTASVRVDGNEYDGRIASITPITRSFGRDNLPAASTTKLRIANEDFGADWLFDRTTVATQVLQARFRLTAYLYDSRAYATAADALSGASQTIGIFTCLNQPEMMDAAIDVTLSDDSLGRLAEPLTTPTVRDWFDQATLINFPLGSPIAGMDWDVPLPIVFGLGEYGVQVPAYSAIEAYEEYPNIGLTDGVPNAKAGDRTFPLIVCVSREGNYFGSTEITRLQATYRDDVQGVTEFRGRTIEIPRVFQVPIPTGHYNIEIWKPKRSGTITKSGRNWQVIYIDFNVDLYVVWFLNTFYDRNALSTGGGGGRVATGWVPVTNDATEYITSRGAILGAFASFKCNGSPLSVMSVMPAIGGEDSTAPTRRLVDFIFDAIGFYSKATPVDIDTAAFARASKARATVLGGGIIQPGRPRPQVSHERYGWVSPNPRDGIVGVLRTALGELCGSCDADLFMTKEGLYSIATNVFDYTAVTATRTSIDESRIQRPRVRTPSQGERWEPYNRVMLSGPGGMPFGPYDNQDAIDAWGVVRSRTLQAKWSGNLLWGEGGREAASTVWHYRSLESKVRPAIRFLGSREYLALELGEYFDFTLTRGGLSTVFSDAVFRLEAQRINTLNLSVELDAIWANDLVDDSPYLLDDEDFLVRMDPVAAGGLALTLEDGNRFATIASPVFDNQGVTGGDILVLKDTTQADNVFTRCRKIRIISRAADDTIELDTADLDFDYPTPTALAAAYWYIERGATTYPDSVSDPTNYPSDGEMYGKACDDDDEYSDASAANQLLDG